MIWLRLKHWLSWIWWRYFGGRVYGDDRRGRMMVAIVYGPGFEGRAAFINGRFVRKGPDLVLTFQKSCEVGEEIAVNLSDWEVGEQ